MPVANVQIHNSGFSHPCKCFIDENASFTKTKLPNYFVSFYHNDDLCLFDTGYNVKHQCPTNLHEKLFQTIVPVTKLPQRKTLYDKVKYVFISHFHSDHIDGLKLCTNATFVFKKYTTHHGSFYTDIIANLLPDDFDDRKIVLDDSDFTTTVFGTFPAHNVFKDSSVRMVDLPGHMDGHVGLLIGDLFCVGDACWLSSYFRNSVTPNIVGHAIQKNHQQYYDTIYKIGQVHRQHPQLNILPSHCPEWVNYASMGQYTQLGAPPFHDTEFDKKQVLVTGATGFIGLHLCQTLASGSIPFYAVGRNREKGRTIEGTFIELDLTTDPHYVYKLVKSVDVVVNCAALCDDTASYQELHPINVQVVETIVNACLVFSKKLVHLSSSAIYLQHGINHYKINEQSEFASDESISTYGKTKKEAEFVIERHMKHGLNATVLRVRGVFGRNDTTITPVLKAMTNRKILFLPNNDNVIDLTHVDNVVQAIMLSIHQDNRGAYCISNNRPLKFKYLLTEFLNTTENKPVVLYINPHVFYYMSWLIEWCCWAMGKIPPINRYRASLLLSTIEMSIDKATAFGYNPSNIHDGLVDYFSWLSNC